MDADGSKQVESTKPDPTVGWSRIEAAFDELLDLEAADRPEALARLRVRDPALGREVAALLAADEAPGDPLGEAVSDALERSVTEERTPESIGPYRILRELGRGGMGIVYLAERDDSQYRHLVAVKLLKRGLETADLLRRLRQERQILAGLEHPAIPRLLGGGSTEGGQPYLAMEFVDGEPIDIYCDLHRLGIKDRLELFARVCDAVQYAHGQLIVHRDLKPANILVTAVGDPKLLDFGIAKILAASPWPHTRAETQWGARLLTPVYASPEQRAGGLLSTATDVYSLGVILHLLLTGRLPETDPGSDTSPACSAEHIADRRGTTPKGLQKRLRGDLETLLVKALQPEAGRRYGSVQQMVDDIRRHLENRPISARPDAWTYHVGKFVRRHRTQVVAGVLLFASLSAGLVGTTWQAHRARRQTARAEHFLDMLVEASRAADPWANPGEVVPVDRVLDDWAQRLRTWMRQYPSDQAMVLETIGRVRLHQGRLDDAEQALSSVVREHETSGAEPEHLSRALAAMAELRFAQGRWQEAETQGRRALSLRRQAGPDHPELAESLNDLGAILEAQGRSEEALQFYSEALELRRRLLGPEDPATANSLGNLGALVFHQGRLDEAELHLRSAVATLEKAYGPAHPTVTEHRTNLAEVLRQNAKVDEAETLMRAALAAQLEVLGEGHSQVARSRVGLASMLFQSGQADEAERLLRAAIDSQLESAGPRHPIVAELSIPLADLRFRLGDVDEAEALYENAVDIWRSQPNARPTDRRRSLGRLANLRSHLGRHEEAVPLFQELLDVTPGSREDPGLNRGRWLLALGKSLAALGRADQASEVLTDAACLLQFQGKDPAAAIEALERLKASRI